MKVNRFLLCRMAGKLARATHQASKSTLEQTIKRSIEACKLELQQQQAAK